MPKLVKYSKLFFKLDKKIRLPIKNIENILLDIETRYNLDEEKHAKNINSIIISKKLFNIKFNDIRIIYTKAKNIYVEGYTNLGGITIPYNIINNYIDLRMTFSDKENINKLNILHKENIAIDLDGELKEISIRNNQDKMKIVITYKYKVINYEIDELGNVTEIKYSYCISEKDIKDNNLDLTKLTEYKHLIFPSANIETLIINKHYIENINKIYFLTDSRYVPFHTSFKFSNLIIKDDNNMKLRPLDLCFDNSRNKIVFKKDREYFISIGDETLIFLDKNNNIKVLDKTELLKDSNIENIIFDNKNTLLILIKHKDYYKVIDFDNEYILKDDFFRLISNNIQKYLADESLVKEIYNSFKNNDLSVMHDHGELYHETINIMYNDYIEYKKYIEKLYELGFSEDAILYLIDKKFNNIINPNENIIEDITSNEIEHFNSMANEYKKVKRLKYEE